MSNRVNQSPFLPMLFLLVMTGNLGAQDATVPLDQALEAATEAAKQYIGTPLLAKPEAAQWLNVTAEGEVGLTLPVADGKGGEVLRKFDLVKGLEVTWPDGSQSQIVSVAGLVRAPLRVGAGQGVEPWRVIMAGNDTEYVPVLVQFQGQVVYAHPDKFTQLVDFLVRARRAQEWHAVGSKAGEKAAEKWGKNVVTVKQYVVDGRKEEAFKEHEDADPEDADAFREGFQAAIDAAKKRWSMKSPPK